MINNKSGFKTNKKILGLQKKIRHLESQLQKKSRQLENNSSSESLYKNFIEYLKTDCSFYRHDKKRIFSYLSPSIKKVLGYSQKEFCKHPYKFLVNDKKIVPQLEKHLKLTLKGIEQPPFEISVYKKNGKMCHLLVMETPVYDKGKKEFNVIGMIRDITKFKQAENEIIKSQSSYNALLNAVPDMIFHLHKDGTFINFRPSTDIRVKPLMPPEQFIGKKISEILPPNISKSFSYFANESIKKGKVQSFEYALPYQDKKLEFETRIVPVNKSEVICIVRDITEIKNIEKSMHEKYEEHRRSIGQDLHDSVSQILTGVAFIAKGLEKKLKERNLDESKDVSLIIKLANKSINQTRHLSQWLHPFELKSNGLENALKELALETERFYRIPCAFHSSDKIELTDSNASIHLYRIAQEAITNALKHSKTTRIQISLKHHENGILLSVADNGAGIPKNPKNNRGLGLKIMNHRAQIIGASFELKNSFPKGTTILCHLPSQK